MLYFVCGWLESGICDAVRIFEIPFNYYMFIVETYNSR